MKRPDHDSDGEPVDATRRRLLAAGGTVAIAALAGCALPEGEGGEEDGEGGEEDGEGGEGGEEGEEGGGGEGSLGPGGASET